MKRTVTVIAVLFAIFVCTTSLASDGPAAGAPPQLQHFAILIGEWKTTEERLKQDGSAWEPSNSAQWNFYWSFNGWGVRDDYISPPLSEDIEDESKRTFGTNLRIFNPGTEQWVMTWLTPGSTEPGNFTATSTADEIVMLSEKPNPQGFFGRITFFDMSESSFEWKLEWSTDKESWLEVYRIHGKRGS